MHNVFFSILTVLLHSALREKLGLPPLAIEGSAEDIVDPEKDAYDNFQRIKQEKERAAKEEEIRKNIEK
jgi:U4/U6.U5 tri-snRNP-associated protein 1